MGNYVITGAASGIGAAIAAHLQSDGHTAISVDLKNADVIADLSNRKGRNLAIEGIEAACSNGLNGLVTCAGIGANVPNGKLISAVNYNGSVELIAGLRSTLAASKAAVVMISSNSAPHETNQDYITALLEGDETKAEELAASMPTQQVYSGSKQAVARWMRSYSSAYAHQGIRLNAVAPGYTETAMTKAVSEDPVYGDAIKQFVKSIPIGRAGSPTDIANAVSFLLSEKASFVCGSMLYVDGGHDAELRPNQI